MNTIYRAGVIGCGMGGMLSLKALHASPRYELVAAVDLNADARARVESTFPGITTYDSAEALFARGDLDVICVSTYAPTHKSLALAAMDCGVKGLLVEKPIGETAQAGADIVHAAAQRNLPMVVPHGLAVMKHVEEICARVWTGEIGALRTIEIQCDKWDILNAGIHWLHFAVTLLRDEPVRYVLCQADTQTRTYRDGLQVETMAVTYAESESGVRIVMQTGDFVTLNEPGNTALFRLVGTAGILSFHCWTSAYTLFNSSTPAPGRIEVTPHPRSNHQIYLDTLAAHIDAGTRDETIARNSLAALELCEAAYLSAAHRCIVPLPLATFTPPQPNDWRPGQPYSGTGGGRDGRKLS
jgi:predicted dehydrogenase